MMMTMFIIYRRLEGRNLLPRSRFSIINRSNYRELWATQSCRISSIFLRWNLQNSFEFLFLEEFQTSNTLISDLQCEYGCKFTFDKFPWIASIVWQVITKEHAAESRTWWVSVQPMDAYLHFCLGATATQSIHSYLYYYCWPILSIVDTIVLVLLFITKKGKRIFIWTIFSIYCSGMVYHSILIYSRVVPNEVLKRWQQMGLALIIIGNFTEPNCYERERKQFS